MLHHRISQVNNSHISTLKIFILFKTNKTSEFNFYHIVYTRFWTMCFVLKHSDTENLIYNSNIRLTHHQLGLFHFANNCFYFAFLPCHEERLTSAAIFILTHGENLIINLCLKPRCRMLQFLIPYIFLHKYITRRHTVGPYKENNQYIIQDTYSFHLNITTIACSRLWYNFWGKIRLIPYS